MATVHCKMYYVGQGGLNCVWVEDYSSKVIYAAVIDCGTDSYAYFEDAFNNSINEVKKILKNAEKVEFFITHIDRDHINKFDLLFEYLDYDKLISVYVASVKKDEYDLFFKKFGNNVTETINMCYIGECTIGTWNKSVIYDLEIMCIVANMGDKTNDRCAIFGFRTWSHAFIFSGDATSVTFVNMLYNDTYGDVRSFRYNRDLFMTIPHHGGCYTLIGDLVTVNKNTKIVNFSKFNEFFAEFNLLEGHYFASAGRMHKHPDHTTMNFFKTIAAEGFQSMNYIAYNNSLYKLENEADPPGEYYNYPTEYRAIYGSIFADEGGNDKPFTYTPPDSYSLSAHEIVSSTDSNDDSYSITAYDHKLRPYFTDKFQKTTNDLGESETVSTRKYHQTFGGERID